MTGRRRRTLTPGEQSLWAQVTRHIAPLPGRAPVEDPAPAPPPAASPVPEPPMAAVLAERSPPTRPPQPPPLAPLERRLRQRLSRGQHPIDAVIDLHGMRQAEAHVALHGFLARSQAMGLAVVLVVTGKGAAAADPVLAERGVLRRVVPHWLRSAELRGIVMGFEEAVQHHGGSGALYVRLRRRRGEGTR